MSALALLLVLAAYYGLLFVFSRKTQTQEADSLNSFFLSGRKAPWGVVAFGMVGTMLSGVTFVSVPGDVGVEIMPGVWKGMGYLQLIMGSFLGTALIILVLLPLYYRHRLTSIYAYLGTRFGRRTYLTGAWLFLISRTLGSAIRLYLAVYILQFLIYDKLGIPFEINALISLAFILLYTHKGGMRTIIWTDTLQTGIMLLALFFTLFTLIHALGAEKAVYALLEGPHSQLFFWDLALPNQFFKQLLSGMAIALVMTGLDQDMMQKNLSCRTLAQSQKNMLVSGCLYTLVNFFFVSLGVLLYAYAANQNIALPPAADQVYPFLATHYLGDIAGVFLVLGIIAAAYSSADGSLTALTTSFCIDIYQLEKKINDIPEKNAIRFRKKVHWAFTLTFAFLLIMFENLKSVKLGPTNIITMVLQLAGYTYGPLLGLYALGIFSQIEPPDKFIPVACIASPLFCLALQKFSPVYLGYTFGFELIFVNALIVILLCVAAFYGAKALPARP
jgi:Na+/proline symporter